MAALAGLGELLLALVALALLVWAAWRVWGRAPSRLMRVVARLPLEPRRALYLIEVAGEYFLVGAGEGGLSTLAELSPESVRAALASLPEAPSLAERLLALAKRPKGPA